MAAPTYDTSSAGITDAGGAWSYNFSSGSPGLVGNVIVFQLLQDGTTTGAVTLTSTTGIEDLAGTDGAWTTLALEQPCGSTTAALQSIYIGRTTGTTGGIITGANSTSEDLYVMAHIFVDVNTGSTLAAVIENSTAGSFANDVGTGQTVTDTAVVTLGTDRLAINLVGGNDDPTGYDTPFSGQSGGTWVWRNGFGSSTGTDGSLTLHTAAMATAGTINGGSFETTASYSWGCIGFALIGTTAGGNTYEKAGFGRESM